jgi:benzil reductase ((S)-benzoin forming)
MKKLAIITGPTAGIGLAMARALADDGFDLHAIARNADKLQATGLTFTAIEILDLCRERDVATALHGLDLSGYDLAVLVNNAGTLDPMGRFDGIDLPTTASAMMLNGLAPIFLSQVFHNCVLATPGCVGRIVQLTSGAANRPVAGWTIYCASKAAMWMATQVMAEEMDTTRCQIMALSPGVVATGMQAQIRAQSEEQLPSVQWFRDMDRDGKLASPDKPAQYLCGLLRGDDFPHGESIDLFAA